MSELNRFINALVIQESGGRYDARGVVTKSGDRAYGKYQIMGANIPAWSREVLGRSITVAEFMANPKLQDQIAIGKLTKYYNLYGARGAAVAWYAGPGAVATRQFDTKSQYGGPSIKAYGDQVLARMGSMPDTLSGGGSAPNVKAGGIGMANAAAAPAEEKYSLEDYGFSAAFFGSDKELKALVDKAVQSQWTPEKFAIELKNTKWFKTKSAAEREWVQLTTSDPATARRQLEIRTEEIKRLALQVGAQLTAAQITDIATKSLRFGYSDQETQKNVATLGVNYVKGQAFTGDAGASQDQINQVATTFGISMSEAQVARWVKDLAVGVKSEQDFDNWIKAQAKLMYPGLSKQIDQGLTVEDVAGIYRRQMSDVLEINEADIDLTKDPMLKKALSWRDPNGKGEMDVIPLWQFEADLKKDPRWLKTNNARDSLMGVAGDVLRSFGFKS